MDVNERPKDLIGGRQSIITPDGYVIPLAVRHGLAYMDMYPPSDHDLDSFPHVVFTQAVMLSGIHPSWMGRLMQRPLLGEILLNPLKNVHPGDFEENLELCLQRAQVRTPDSQLEVPDPIVPQKPPDEEISTPKKGFTPKSILGAEPDFEKLRPNFGWIPACGKDQGHPDVHHPVV